MTSLQSLWALTSHLGLNPSTLLPKAGEAAGLRLGGKAAMAAGRKATGAAKAVLAYWSQSVEAQFPIYLEDRLKEVEAEDQPAVIAAAFSDWVASRADEPAELACLLFRLIYLRALIGHCADLPVLSGSRFDLDDVWVPQCFLRRPAESSRQRPAAEARYAELEDALSSSELSICVLVGDSGAGKSTQLRKLVLDIARRQLDTTDFPQLIAEPLPIYLQAKTLIAEAGDLTTAIAQALARELGFRLPFELPDRFLDSRQPGAAPSILLVIDGLDEISPEQRDTLVSTIRQHREGFTILLGSRTPLPHFDIGHFEIEAPTGGETDRLLHKLAGTSGKTKLDWSGLPRNPLILTLGALLQRQDITSRATLYREFLIDRLTGSAETVLHDPRTGLALLECCALDDGRLANKAEGLASALLPAHLIGLSRGRRARELLLATGVIREAGDQLVFLHESFPSFLKAEALARRHRPSPAPWEKVSPFRVGWEVLGFIFEIWRGNGEDIAPALEGLLAFGEDGLRLVGRLADRDAGLPVRVVDAVISKWMHGDDEDWSPGYMNGPVQELGLLARHYEGARKALRKIARDTWTYHEDAAYAGQALARAGLTKDGEDFLAALCRKKNSLWETRALACDLLIDIGSIPLARTCALELAGERPFDAIDVHSALVDLASILHKLGETRAMQRVLKQVEDEIGTETDEGFGLKRLAEFYLEIGNPRKAKAAALRAFKTFEWTKRLLRGDTWSTGSLARLLKEVGATKEAAQIRRHLDENEGKSIDDLVAKAHDRRNAAEERLSAARELFKQQRELGLAAIEALLNDSHAESYTRFTDVSRLLESSARARTIGTFRRIADDEPRHRVACAMALVAAGEPENGCAMLAKVALEPGEEVRDRVRALEALARSGKVELATAAFRRMLNAGDINHSNLTDIEAALAYTSGWTGFLDACEKLLVTDDPQLRMAALAVLIRASRISRETRRATNLLQKIAKDRTLDPDIRQSALIDLEDVDGDAIDIASDIADAPEESMEAGLMATEFLNGRDAFESADCGHAVVWDKKLSDDQFIAAAHRFLAMLPPRGEDESDLGDWGHHVGEAMQARLIEIAADPKHPIERRLFAAGISGRTTGWSDQLRRAVDAICDDESLTLRQRLPAIHTMLSHNPGGYDRWKDALWSGAIERIEAAYACLTDDIYMRDVAAEFFHAALAQEEDLRERVRIWQALVGLNEAQFAGAQSAEALQHVIATDASSLDEDLVTSLLELSRGARGDEAYRRLVIAVAGCDQLSSSAFISAAHALVAADLKGVAQDLFDRRASDWNMQTSKGKLYDYLILLRAQARMGGLADPSDAVDRLCTNAKFDIVERSFACRILSQLGRTRDAHRHLEKLGASAKTFNDRLWVAQNASALHNWPLARRILLECATASKSINELCCYASALRAAGLKSHSLAILEMLDPQAHEFWWEGGFDLLLECGRPHDVIAICHAYLQNAALDVDDRIVAIGKLGEAGHVEIARWHIIDLVEREKLAAQDYAMAAVALHDIGFEAEARTMLFDLTDQVDLDPSARLWVAHALLNSNLSSSATSMLDTIDDVALDDDDRGWLAEMKAAARLVTRQRDRCIH